MTKIDALKNADGDRVLMRPFNQAAKSHLMGNLTGNSITRA